MKIGVVVPVLNRFKKTFKFIQALERQTYQGFHLYLADSGSTDGTHLLPSYTKIGVSFINACKDDWWTGATNKGVKQAIIDGCTHILTINDDSVITSTYLERLVEISENNNLDILGSRVDFLDNPGKIWCMGAYNNWGTRLLFQLKYHGEWVDDIPKEVLDKKFFQVEALCGNGILIKKEVFDKIGFYDEVHCPHYHADSEFILRANKFGFSSYTTTDVIVYNDTNNYSEKEQQPTVATKLSWLNKEYKNFESAFLSIRSDLYYKPVFYIIKKNAPKELKWKTIFIFYFHWFYTFYLTRIIHWGKSTKWMPNFIKNFGYKIVKLFSSKWNSLNYMTK